jgi:hypothetical protein
MSKSSSHIPRSAHPEAITLLIRRHDAREAARVAAEQRLFLKDCGFHSLLTPFAQ